MFHFLYVWSAHVLYFISHTTDDENTEYVSITLLKLKPSHIMVKRNLTENHKQQHPRYQYIDQYQCDGALQSEHINNSAAPVSESDFGSIRVQVVEWEVFICAATAVEELNPPLPPPHLLCALNTTLCILK